MLFSFIAWNLFLVVLILLGAASIYLSFSGYLPGRTYVGWIFLGVYILLFGPFAYASARSAHGPFLMFGMLLLFGLLLAMHGPLVAELISQAVMPDPSMGLKLIKVYTEAEKRVAQDDIPGAIAEYENVIAGDPDDMYARSRLAELCYENREYRRAAKAYEEMLARARGLEMGRHCSALTRLSEIYARHLGDVETARRHIQTIIEKYPDTKYAAYAMDRLENL